MKTSLRITGLALIALAAPACHSAGFTSSVKTDSSDQKGSLVDDIQACRDDLVSAQDQFEDTNAKFTKLLQPDQEDLTEAYAIFLDEVDSSAVHAEDVASRMQHIREQAAELFVGWRHELDQFSSEGMRSYSEEMLAEALKAHDRLVTELEETHDHMQLLLVTWRDYALFFNHNLHSAGIQRLEAETKRYHEDFSELAGRFASVRAEAETFQGLIEGHASR